MASFNAFIVCSLSLLLTNFRFSPPAPQHLVRLSSQTRRRLRRSRPRIPPLSFHFQLTDLHVFVGVSRVLRYFWWYHDSALSLWRSSHSEAWMAQLPVDLEANSLSASRLFSASKSSDFILSTSTAKVPTGTVFSLHGFLGPVSYLFSFWVLGSHSLAVLFSWVLGSRSLAVFFSLHCIIRLSRRE